MTPRSVPRAVERKQKTAVCQTAMHAAAIPVPVPDEPEPPPRIPLPDVKPGEEGQPEPEKPQLPTACHDDILIAGESLDEFNEFSERLFDHYMPYDQEERVLVRKLIESRWFLKRRKDVFNSVEATLYTDKPDPSKWSEDDFKRLAVADTYCLQAEQVVNRAQRKVNAFVQQRTEDNRFQAKMDIAYNNFILGRKKYEFSLWKAGLRPKAAEEDEAEPKPATKTAFVS